METMYQQNTFFCLPNQIIQQFNSLFQSQFQVMGSKQSNVPPEEETYFAYKQMIKKTTITDPLIYYQFVELLGEGCYSSVFKVRSKSTGQFRALKKMQKGKDPKINRHLSNEFQILKQMDHPNIVKMYEMFQDNTHYYIVTEYLEGKDALQLLQKHKTISEQLAFNIFYQLILAINYIHINKFMHRDIKLENIIYNQKNGCLKLLDFGSALKFQENKPKQRRCTGTIHYIAPEVINKYYNYKCDIWSLGILLYVLLSGNAPFIANDHQTIINKILNQSLNFPNPIWNTRSDQAKKLIAKMLQKNFQKRVGINEILMDPWIQSFRSKNIIHKPLQEMTVTCIQSMQKFIKLQITNIQLGILIFMINAIIKPSNQVWLIKAFHIIDNKQDGQLDQAEIKNALVKFAGVGNKKAEELTKEFMNKIDVDSSGFISFTEFVLAAINLRQILTKENINKTFKYIDTDGSGKLSVHELRNRLGDHIEHRYYSKLVKIFDKNGDGQISRQQFETMMKGIISSY